MTEFLEIYTHPAGLPVLVPLHRIVHITPDQDTGGCRILYDRGHGQGLTHIVDATMSYAQVRALLQPINVAA